MRTRAQRSQGAELAELAILMPFLGLLILVICECAAVVATHQVISNAAREGARLSSVQGVAVSDVQNEVIAYAAANNLTLTTADISVNQNALIHIGGNSCSAASPCLSASQVTVSYTYALATAIGSLASVPLAVTVEMRNMY